MRSIRLIALVLIAGCAQSGADLFKKQPLPDASSDAFVVPAPDARPDSGLKRSPDSEPDAMPDAMPDAPP